MDKAEAIKRLEDLINTWGGEPFVQESVDAFKLAIVALREQEQREQKPMTNADRIRAMTDEELAVEIHAYTMHYAPWCDYHCENEGDDGCDKCIEKWLKQPVKEGADHE